VTAITAIIALTEESALSMTGAQQCVLTAVELAGVKAVMLNRIASCAYNVSLSSLLK